MNKDFAVIMTGGKQYRVAPGQKVKIEKLDAEPGNKVMFDKVLLRSIGGNVEVGMPNVSGNMVEGKLVRTAKEKTKIVFRYHPKVRYQKKKGHRQVMTEVEIVKI